MADIFRRDPRVEWIQRNRLHPLHGQYSVTGPLIERGPTGLIRKNPHKVGFIGPNGLKRIDRLAGDSPQMATKRGQVSQQVEQLPLHQVVEPTFYIVTVLDMVGGRLTEHDKDVLGQAHKLVKGCEGSGAVVAVIYGAIKETQFDLAGVDRIIHFVDDAYDSYNPELRLNALQAIDQQLDPMHWLFPDSINGGAELGARLAAKLKQRPAIGVWQLDNQTSVGRGSDSIDIKQQAPRIILLAQECADPIDETRHEVKPMTLDIEVAETMGRVVNQGAVSVDPSQIPLAEAEFILSAGNGIEDWDLFHSTATLLRATEGASRVAVDDGFMPRMRQVGATGTWVTAQVYVAVGISGAIQHMQGIGQCQKVVAINSDAGCDMVKRADLSIIDDSSVILTELQRLLAEENKGESDD